MEWYVILVLVLGILMILFPVAFMWYLVVGGIYSAARETTGRRRVIRQALEIVMNREAFHQLIREAIGTIEDKQGTPEGAYAKSEQEQALLKWAMPTPVPGINRTELVIVGGSAAGIQAAITAKRLHNMERITVIRKEHEVLMPCGIPYIFDTLGSEEKNLIPDALLGNTTFIIDEVTSLNKVSQTVDTAGGKTIGYDKLILATGSRPVVPPIAGVDINNVFTITKDIEHLQRLEQALSEAGDVVVVGGGFTGVALADECRKRGLNVTIVELLPHCLFMNCDEEFCILMEEELTKANIRLMCQNSVKSILGNGWVSEVELSSGERLKADLVIISMGMVPNTKLAKKAGLDIGATKGIRVGRYMRTGYPNIFAIGDCAEKLSFFTGKPVPLLLASIATQEARMAVANLFKPRVKNSGAIGVFSTNVGNAAIGVAGLTERAAREAGFDVIIGKSCAQDKYLGAMTGTHQCKVKLIFARESGRLLGGEVYGGASVGELTNTLAVLVQNRATRADICMSQVGTHPALTASPIVYQITNAAEQAVVANYQGTVERIVEKQPGEEKKLVGAGHSEW